MSPKEEKRHQRNLHPTSSRVLFSSIRAYLLGKIVGQIVQEILLPLDAADMWFEHVKQASENRARGAKKAAETRKKQKAHHDTGKERCVNQEKQTGKQEKQTGKQRKKSKRNEKSTSGPDRSEPNEEIVKTVECVSHLKNILRTMQIFHGFNVIVAIHGFMLNA